MEGRVKHLNPFPSVAFLFKINSQLSFCLLGKLCVCPIEAKSNWGGTIFGKKNLPTKQKTQKAKANQFPAYSPLLKLMDLKARFWSREPNVHKKYLFHIM